MRCIGAVTSARVSKSRRPVVGFFSVAWRPCSAPLGGGLLSAQGDGGVPCALHRGLASTKAYTR